MEELIARVQAVLDRVPGPGKLLFGNLTADRKSFSVLAACLVAILCTYLTPPVITLGSPPIEAGLRTIGSGVPIIVAASYLLMAILTMLAGGTGDAIGHKRMLLFGLGAVVFGELASMFWLGTPGFKYADTVLNLAQLAVTPMCVAIVSFAFVPGVRPFAYGVLFSTQAIAIGLSSALYSVLKPLGNGTIVFFLPVVLGVIGLRLIQHAVHETERDKPVEWRELLVNVAWIAAVLLGVYGIVAFAGGFTSRNALLILAAGLGGLALAYRFFYRRLRKRGTLKLYDVRSVGFAVLAAMVGAMLQAALFYQFWTYFIDVRGLGPVAASLAYTPLVLGMMVGTTVIVRLATRFDARRLIAAGLLLAAIGMIVLALVGTETPLPYLIVPFAVVGLGLGITGPARTSVILTAPPPRLIGSGAGINSAAGQAGYALGVITSSLFISGLAGNALANQLRQAGVAQDTITQVQSALGGVFARAMSGDFTKLPANADQALTAYLAPAFTTAMGQTMLIMGGLAAAAAVAIYIAMERGLKGSMMEAPAGANPTSPAADAVVYNAAEPIAEPIAGHKQRRQSGLASRYAPSACSPRWPMISG